jgi:hypothetical protein
MWRFVSRIVLLRSGVQAIARSVMPPRRTAFEGVTGTAVWAQRLTRILYRQEYARMRIPQQHGWHGAVERQIIGSNFDLPLFIISRMVLHRSFLNYRCTGQVYRP